MWNAPDRNDRHGHARLAFDIFHIGLELGRKILVTAHLLQIGFPPLELTVDGFHVVLNVVGELRHATAVDLVGLGHLDRIEIVHHVGLHHDEFRHAVDHDGIFERHHIEPAATTLAPRHRTELMTEPAQCLARLVEQLRRERPAAHARTIGLEDAVDLADTVGADAEARAGARTDRIRRGHERVRTEIDVEQRTLCAFGQNGLVFGEEAVDFVLAVDDAELFEVFDPLEPLSFQFVDIVAFLVFLFIFNCFSI